MKPLNLTNGDAASLERKDHRDPRLPGKTGVAVRKPYCSPALTAYGSLTDLTQNVGFDFDDGMRGSAQTA